MHYNAVQSSSHGVDINPQTLSSDVQWLLWPPSARNCFILCAGQPAGTPQAVARQGRLIFRLRYKELQFEVGFVLVIYEIRIEQNHLHNSFESVCVRAPPKTYSHCGSEKDMWAQTCRKKDTEGTVRAEGAALAR